MARGDLMLTKVAHTFQAKDGTLIEVRPMQREDAVHLIDIFDHMGLDSRYTRFNMAMPTPEPERVQQEAAEMVDFERPESDGWLAFADLPDGPDTPVAGIRYIHTGPGEAEIALSVRDDMQNKGIGTALFTYLLEQAKEAGISRLVGLAQRNNPPLFQLLNNVPYPVKRTPDGSYVHLEVSL
jgi:GNAT superfamily N-acetyltransferase